MTLRIYALTSSILFLLIAAFGFSLLFTQLDVAVLLVDRNKLVVIDGWHLPMWASIAAVLVSGFLGFVGYRLFRDQRLSSFRTPANPAHP
jgi:hypothetical protein